MTFERSTVDLAVVCDSEGAVATILYDSIGVTCQRGSSFQSLVDPASQGRASDFLAELRVTGSVFDVEMNVVSRHLSETLRFAGGFTGTGYCIVGTRANPALGLMDALDELMQINSEQLNSIRSILRQRETIDRKARVRAVQDFDEVKRLNNELVLAQRELALQNAHLSTTLAELEQAHAEAATQRDRIERASSEILRSNQELQQFAYVASHDLEAPLRNVQAFVELLDSNYGQSLDDRARRWMRHIVTGTKSMRALVSGILAYSRVETRGGEFVAVDMNEVVEQSRSVLEAPLRTTSAILTRDELPTVRADPIQMKQLVQNLLQNALTYKGESAPRIHFGATREGSAWKVSVRDNGIGIAPEHHEQIFSMLYRIHPKYPGSGLGLAICRQIVNRHCGSIWVESEPGEGSTFFFTLPDPAASKTDAN